MSYEPNTVSALSGTEARPGPRIPRRILAAWFPWWATERLARQCPEARAQPFVIAGESRNRQVITAANPRATRAGLVPGMPLADGRAIVPGVVVRPADPAGDARALEQLARWADRFTPRVMPDGIDTLFLDIGGCARLFGGEDILAASLRAALENFGLTVRLALADTPGAAWALAHYAAEDPAVVPSGAGPSGLKEALAELPVPALRLSTDVVDALASFGLDRISTLSVMESVKLTERFGLEPVRRLEQAFGLRDEPIAPLRPRLLREAHRAFAEPISTAEDIRAAVDGLLDNLCLDMSRAGEGARRLRLVCHRADGGKGTVTIGTSRPLRRKKPLMGLFADKLDQVEPGFGIDEIVLASDVVETIDEVQTDWDPDAGEHGHTGDDEELAGFLDRLGNRFGFGRIARPVPYQSWLPERAVQGSKHLAAGVAAGSAAVAGAPAARAPAAGAPATGATSAAGWPENRDRPLRLLSPPEAVQVEVGGRDVPRDDAPPPHFRRRGQIHRVREIRGPERLECEWWREDAPPRDYYLAEDEAGRRYWLFREASRSPGARPRWFLHGVFG